jgi:putative lipoic acid-binding regulatory protein
MKRVTDVGKPGKAAATSADSDTLFDFPCDFPIKVMGQSHADFASTIIALIQQFDAQFDATRIELRSSGGGNYSGLTCIVRATSRAQLDDIYRALSSHAMVKIVL